MNSALAVFPVESGPVATVGYLVADTAAGRAVIIDAPHGSADAFLQFAAGHGVTVETIWLTHTHWDHIADVAPLVEHTGAGVLVHRDDEYRLADPMKHTIWPLPFSIEPVLATGYFHDGDTVALGGWSFEVVHTPGHTEGGICLVDREQGLAFVGDTLFAGSVGRTDLPGGDTDTLLRSIRERLLPLGDDMAILPGHGPASTIGNERQHNPFLVRL